MKYLLQRRFLSHQTIIFGSKKINDMFEKWRLKRKLKTVTKAKMKAVEDVNFELAANLRAEEKLLLKQLEERKKHKKD